MSVDQEFPPGFFDTQESPEVTKDWFPTDPVTRFGKDGTDELPAGSHMLRKSTRRCGYARPTAANKERILPNGCVVWRLTHMCETRVQIYVRRPAEDELWAESIENQEVTTRFVKVCPDTSGVQAEILDLKHANPAETYSPPSEESAVDENAVVQTAHTVVEDGITYQIRTTLFWKLQYPLMVTGECTLNATYVERIRTEKYVMPGDFRVGVEEEDWHPTPGDDRPRKQTVPVRIPDCPRSEEEKAAAPGPRRETR